MIHAWSRFWALLSPKSGPKNAPSYPAPQSKVGAEQKPRRRNPKFGAPICSAPSDTRGPCTKTFRAEGSAGGSVNGHAIAKEIFPGQQAARQSLPVPHRPVSPWARATPGQVSSVGNLGVPGRNSNRWPRTARPSKQHPAALGNTAKVPIAGESVREIGCYGKAQIPFAGGTTPRG